MRNYDYNLAVRFVSDYKLPIDVCTQTEFEYALDMYEDVWKAKTKWLDLLANIEKSYPDADDPIETFLKDYYDTRDKIITTIENSPEYKHFNEVMFYDVKSMVYPKAKNGSKGIYNQANIGKHFISIDMKNANFQTLRHCGVIKGITYRHFINQYCSGFMCDYITESKYSRQVIFGKLNPSRTISIEKYIIATILYRMASALNIDIEDKLMCINSDEIILMEDEQNPMADKIREWCSTDGNTEVEVRVENFILRGYEFDVVKPDGSEHKLGEFYRKSCDAEGKYKAIPLPYHRILTKLLSNKEVTEQDRIIMYDKCRALLLDPIIVKEL